MKGETMRENKNISVSARPTMNPHQLSLFNRFGIYREEWETTRDAQGHWIDDRGLFCNQYDQLMTAYGELNNVHNAFIRCAVWDKGAEREEHVLQDIIDQYRVKSL
jgi:hypothetical protein